MKEPIQKQIEDKIERVLHDPHVPWTAKTALFVGAPGQELAYILHK